MVAHFHTCTIIRACLATLGVREERRHPWKKKQSIVWGERESGLRDLMVTGKADGKKEPVWV